MKTLYAIPLLVAFALVFVDSAQADTERPNVVLIMADDQGWGDKSPGGESIAFLNRDFSFLSLGSTRLGITASEPSEPFHQPCATSLKQI